MPSLRERRVMMRREFLFTVAWLSVVIAGGIFWLRSTPTPATLARKYIVKVTPQEEAVYVSADRIESTGFCVTFYVRERVDTILCGPVAVTEAADQK